MSNLGLYQLIPTIAKKVGGPKNLILLTMGVGYLTFRTGEAVAKKSFKKAKSIIYEKRKLCGYEELIFEVTSDCKDSSGLELKTGDKYKILNRDKDAILIEILGNENNPYFVSGDFLRTISNFTD